VKSPVQPVGREEDPYPTPFFRPRPSGVAGIFIVAFVIFGFATLFVSKSVAEVLLWVMVVVVLVAVGISTFRVLRSRQ
jgi:hypothetical protein